MKIGIVGLGLIGGCLGLDLRSRGYTVLGVARRPETCRQAIAIGAADEAKTDISLLAIADLIFICTPIAAIAPTVVRLAPHLRPETIVTDVGSVKAAPIAAVEPLWQNFVPGHPMAGKARSGIQAACQDLFRDRPYVLTPTAKTPEASVAVVADLARSLGARLYRCGPEEHDRAVAWVSHLPVTISAALLDACEREPDERVLQLARQLASSGFRDTSRVGGGNPELGLMMARYNREALLQSLRNYRQCLDGWIQAIEREDWADLEQKLQRTQGICDRFPACESQGPPQDPKCRPENPLG